MRLKSERQMLVGGVAVLATLAATLGVALWQDNRSPDVVRLGQGLAGVESYPVTELTPRPVAVLEPEPTPSASASPMGTGEASYYESELAGSRTANGGIFDPGQLTAAHRTLPLGSRVRVTNSRNGESVVVRINDRGPYRGNRVIDLSTAAARKIGLIRSGRGRVNLALLVT